MRGRRPRVRARTLRRRPAPLRVALEDARRRLRLWAGIDGGQTATTCVLGDENGSVVARVNGEAADLVGQARTSPRQGKTLDRVLGAALKAAGARGEVNLATIVAGLSGYDAGESPDPPLRTQAERIRVVHDTEIAHAGAFDGGPGIVVIAGTGSVAFGRDANGASVRVGGWGYLFGDEGSAFWIAREAIARSMRDEDAARPRDFEPNALAHFGVTSLRALQHRFAHGELRRAEVAAFAPVVLRAAREGNQMAEEIRRDAAAALARLAHVAQQRLGVARNLSIAPIGGVFADSALLERWKWNVREFDRGATVVAPRHEPALGALRLAYREDGVEIGALRSALV